MRFTVRIFRAFVLLPRHDVRAITRAPFDPIYTVRLLGQLVRISAEMVRMVTGPWFMRLASSPLSRSLRSKLNFAKGC